MNTVPSHSDKERRHFLQTGLYAAGAGLLFGPSSFADDVAPATPVPMVISGFVVNNSEQPPEQAIVSFTETVDDSDNLIVNGSVKYLATGDTMLMNMAMPPEIVNGFSLNQSDPNNPNSYIVTLNGETAFDDSGSTYTVTFDDATQMSGTMSSDVTGNDVMFLVTNPSTSANQVPQLASTRIHPQIVVPPVVIIIAV